MGMFLESKRVHNGVRVRTEADSTWLKRVAQQVLAKLDAAKTITKVSRS